MPPVPTHGYLKEVLGRDEEVLFLGRQHVLVLLGHVFKEVVFALVVAAAVTTVRVFLLPDHPEVAWFYLLMLLAAPRLLWKVVAWRSRVFAITSRRVIQVSGVLKKVVVDSLLEKVNDLRTDQSLLGRMLGYGDLEILTASEAGRNDMRFIARPLEFKRAILDAKEALDHGGRP